MLTAKQTKGLRPGNQKYTPTPEPTDQVFDELGDEAGQSVVVQKNTSPKRGISQFLAILREMM